MREIFSGALCVGLDERIIKVEVGSRNYRAVGAGFGEHRRAFVNHNRHLWRCTADVSSCKALYEPLCAVDGDYEEWRKIVCLKPSQKCKFVQPNPFLNGDSVEMKVYDESNEGIIQSWAESDI
ncbi:hypothetical protein MY10362_002935 [Beauveria mimosiformis]